jgi:hypothetical protein
MKNILLLSSSSKRIWKPEVRPWRPGWLEPRAQLFPDYKVAKPPCDYEKIGGRKFDLGDQIGWLEAKAKLFPDYDVAKPPCDHED